MLGLDLFCRLLWLMLCMLSLSLGAYMIWDVVQKYDNNPVIISIEETNYPVYKVQFPAVTICSNNKVVRRHFDKAVKQPP